MQKIRFINVVRVLGLFLVLTYHLFQDVLPGGFLGVDVFFTFSGYLITSLMISALENNRTFDFLQYIKRRFLRIFPPLFFSIFFTLPFVILISSDFRTNIDRQITAALSFVTNYFEIISGSSYEAQLIPHLYVHTWSLAIEMHYYLFWGILLTYLLFAMFKFKKHKIHRIKIVLVICSAIFALMSYLNMQFLFSNNSNKSVSYFSTTSHIYPFFIGSILGVLFGLKLTTKASAWVKNKSNFFKFSGKPLLLITLISIIYICCKTNFENDFTYRFGFLIVSILSAFLIFVSRAMHEVYSKNYKESKLIDHIANLSYEMYLFHWPFFIIFSNIFNSKILSAIITIIFSYVFSLLIFYNIEPLFYKASYAKEKIFNKKRKSAILATTLILSSICLFTNAGILITKPEISNLEEEQMVGKVVQNIDKINDFKKGIDNLNKDPFLQKDGIKNFDNLDINTTQKQNVENLSSKRKLSKPQQGTSNSISNINAKITVIGDSVALGARKKLAETLGNAYIDTQGSRSIFDGYNIIKGLQNSNSLGEYLVIALGTNGCENWNAYIDKIIEEIPAGHRLIFVTPYDGHWTETWRSYKTMQYLRGIKNKYPFVTVVDWAAKISTCPELLGSDKTHIGGNETAIKMFVDTVVEGINEAAAKNPK